MKSKYTGEQEIPLFCFLCVDKTENAFYLMWVKYDVRGKCFLFPAVVNICPVFYVSPCGVIRVQLFSALLNCAVSKAWWH